MATVNKAVFIQIGDHEGIPVVPQRHARLRNKLSAEDFAAIMSGDYGRESYRVLGVLIPELHKQVPLYEWEGYASAEAMDNGDYDEEADRSPTTAEIIHAFETALMVSGAGRLGKIVDLVQTGMDMVGSVPETAMPELPASPGENGESPSTSTGAKSPTTS